MSCRCWSERNRRARLRERRRLSDCAQSKAPRLRLTRCGFVHEVERLALEGGFDLGRYLDVGFGDLFTQALERVARPTGLEEVDQPLCDPAFRITDHLRGHLCPLDMVGGMKLAFATEGD